MKTDTAETVSHGVRLFADAYAAVGNADEVAAQTPATKVARWCTTALVHAIHGAASLLTAAIAEHAAYVVREQRADRRQR